MYNDGISVYKKDNNGKKSPVAVVGVARGGTSMVAGALKHLGIFMGERAASPTFEDIELSEAFEKRRSRDIDQIVQRYSQKHDIWGWKRPSSVNYLDIVHRRLNEPLYIFVFKDIYSIASRNNLSMQADSTNMMRRAWREYGKILDFIERRDPSRIMVSYEKALIEPKKLIDTLIEFLSIEPSKEQTESAIDFITPYPVEYLEKARINKSTGRLGGINDGKIFGWARYIHRKHSADVDIYLNDKKLTTLTADRPRKDLMERFGIPCAFVYDLPSNITLKKGDILRARVTDEIRDLDNSPLIIE